jgi:HK97 family phage major capsid protein
MAEQATEIKDVMEAVNAVREKIKEVGKDSPEFKELQEKAEKALESFDDISQKQLLAEESAKKTNEELTERLKTMELELAKGGPAGTKDHKQSEEYKALNKWVKVGIKGMTTDEVKTLRTDVDTGAGYLTTPETDNMIIKQITEISPMRNISRVRTVGKKVLEIPTRTGIPTSNYEGEAEAAGESQSSYGNESLNAWRHSVVIPYTADMLMDSNFDLEAEINGDVSESFAQKEGNKFINGTGVKEPEGFLSVTAITDDARTATGTAGSLDEPNDIIRLTGDLKVGYNPMLGFNRLTLSELRTLQDTAGAYIWKAGTVSGLGSLGQPGSVPNTIAGEPYVILQDMPDIATDAFPVVYADFMRGYTIIDRTGMVVIRDEVTAAANAIIKLTFRRYNGGQVVLNEAFKLLKIN